MIVRVLGEGQYEVDDTEVPALFELDKAVDEAFAAHDEAAFGPALGVLVAQVRSVGRPVANDVILPSDLVLPPDGSSIEEVAELLASEDVDG